MKRTAISAATLALFLLSGAAMAGPAADNPKDSNLQGPAEATTSATLPSVSGTVTKVDEAAGKISIDHQAIPNLSMDPMTMVFKAADPGLLKAAKPGDAVTFTADKVNGQLTVMTLKKDK
jgi:Cu(I)/Ag(I) efflux system protein CusF